MLFHEIFTLYLLCSFIGITQDITCHLIFA